MNSNNKDITVNMEDGDNDTEGSKLDDVKRFLNVFGCLVAGEG